MMSKPASEKMRIIHDPKRPVIDDYITELFDDFIELHGDREFAEDHAICAGVGLFCGTPVTVIGHRKGKTTEENLAANFGMAHPEGYRKALRLAHQAEKFGRPVFCFVDTPGAFCGVGAEERGQGEAIARCLYEFIELRTPVISIVTGEGGSGGALALAVADRVLMLENALYSVISPRGCASILWKDPTREAEAADTLRITAEDLREFGMIEGIVPEGVTNAQMMRNIKRALSDTLAELNAEPDMDTMLKKRYEKFRKIGVFRDNQEFEGV
ncbi:acetyl-CoA carboxylase carboxyltransferase subunit alpha [Butyricicoccus sp. Marseille-Q5471]|uniref:acetyl-CoA carboxylase carboxyltransferase subunit alpha n=1 Tax=Butyricicoccus sp. Marseille-Q5471 TaxID=3039493 RepID=UPI0024BBF2FC|nr:acetyl-CoA carboxylase carboxyltransferase subunit alpha [Butyricicoccus sp. Marseille-Q5471]